MDKVRFLASAAVAAKLGLNSKRKKNHGIFFASQLACIESTDIHSKAVAEADHTQGRGKGDFSPICPKREDVGRGGG